MDLSFYPLTLEALDQANAQANAEALCLFIGEDERPLLGLSGLCDWRLNGSLSRMLRKGLVKGEEGEALLTPGLKLGFRKLFVFGMGPVGQGEEELAARLAERLRRLGRAGVEDAAFQIPQKLSLDVGIRTLIDEPNGPLRARVFGADPAAMVRSLSHAASRGVSEARHERRVIKVPASHKAPPAPPVRKGPVRAGLVEIPRASPLSFAPKGKQEPQRSLGEKSGLKIDEASKLGPEQVEGEKVAAAALGADETPIAPSISEPPIAPSASEPPIAPSASEPPVAPASVTQFAAVPAPQSAEGQKELFEPQASPAKGGKALPVDYKAARFVPPEPKPAPAGGKKKRKKR